MRRRRGSAWYLALVATGLFGGLSGTAYAQFGIVASGVGPINRSMGGAAVAAPIDAAGALYWNPATIGELGHSEMEFGAGFVYPRSTISSRVGANAFGPGVPAAPFGGGNTGGNNGVFLLPAVALVYSPSDSPLAYGFGIFEIGGFGVNYPASLVNPVLSPQAPFGRGVGPLYTQLQLIQFSPALSLKLTDKLSIGGAVNIDMGVLSVDPSLTAVPSLVNTPLGPAPYYPSGNQGRSRIGGGGQFGVFYNANESWNLGASVSTPQWFNTYNYNSLDGQGRPVSPKVGLNFPLIASVGAAYKGIDRLIVASDVRFIDYRDTDGFRKSGFDQRGALRGLGWQNVFALGTGAQYQWTDAFSTRLGDTFGLNPVGPSLTVYNLGSPNIIQHTVAAGASYNVTQALKLSLAYTHDFQNTIGGPLVQPFVGPVNGAVRTSLVADAVYLGATVTF